MSSNKNSNIKCLNNILEKYPVVGNTYPVNFKYCSS